jgi:hypothetical protein
MLSELTEYLKTAGWLSVGTLAVVLLTISSFLLTFSIVELSSPAVELGRSFLWGVVVSATVVAVTGTSLFIKALQGTSTQADQLEKQRRKRLLDRTRELGGQVTIAQLALETRYTLEDVRDDLDKMAKSGVAELDIDDEGKEIYRFPEFDDTDRDQLAVEIEEASSQNHQRTPARAD